MVLLLKGILSLQHCGIGIVSVNLAFLSHIEEICNVARVGLFISNLTFVVQILMLIDL